MDEGQRLQRVKREMRRSVDVRGNLPAGPEGPVRVKPGLSRGLDEPGLGNRQRLVEMALIGVDLVKAEIGRKGVGPQREGLAKGDIGAGPDRVGKATRRAAGSG